MQLARIHRYPVKGMSPDRLDAATLEPGRGLPFDRAAAFTSGNLPDPPQAGGWVPARTFLQLTVYPELAGFRMSFDEPALAITVIAPDGAKATARLGEPETFAEANALIRRHFAPGPHGIPELHEQARERGHWDFTDTALSICNIETLRSLEAAAGRPVDPTRFRANLYIDGVEAWEEFGLIGRRLRVGEAELEVLRPAMRCAATSVDPQTGDVSLDVPMLLRRSVGHLFCAVYARVARAGRIAAGDPVAVIGDTGRNPTVGLPPRAPDPRLWPRIVEVNRSDGSMRLESTNDAWPLAAALPGSTIRLHPGLGGLGAPLPVTIEEADEGAYVVRPTGELASLAHHQRLIVTGPYGKGMEP